MLTTLLIRLIGIFCSASLHYVIKCIIASVQCILCQAKTFLINDLIINTITPLSPLQVVKGRGIPPAPRRTAHRINTTKTMIMPCALKECSCVPEKRRFISTASRKRLATETIKKVRNRKKNKLKKSIE